MPDPTTGCVCGRHTLRPRHYRTSLVDDCLGLFDNQYYESTTGPNSRESRIPHTAACRTAEKAQQMLDKLQRQLARGGLMVEQQRFCGTPERARVMAPFRKGEIVLGSRLGTGGFSSVYEIDAFYPLAETSAKLSTEEQAARDYLAETAHRMPEAKNSFGSTARYAVKHLRSKMATDEEKFEKAAIDLTLEAQLLLVCDHPHIVGIRGWTKHGTDAFRAGSASDFFLILDCLPETLEDRLYSWRTTQRKYCSRVQLPWNRRRNQDKLDALLTDRLAVAHDIASAMEYLHERRIINRDLKTSNIGFNYESAVQIFDLGLSRLLPAEDKQLDDGYVMSRVGTKSTMAPEVRRKEPYTLSADVYSFGVVLWEVLAMATSSEYIRRHRKQINAEDDYDSLPLPVCECWPQDIRNLLNDCLSYTASDRPSMTQVRKRLADCLLERGRPPTIKRSRSSFRLDLTDAEYGMDAKSLTASTVASTVATTILTLDMSSLSDHVSEGGGRLSI